MRPGGVVGRRISFSRVQVMKPLSMPRLVLRRLADGWVPLVSIFFGIVVATTVIAAAPIYLASLERLALDLEIDGLKRPLSNINVFAFNTPLTRDDLRDTRLSLEGAIERHIAPIYESRERYLAVDTYLAGLPGSPLPASGGSSGMVFLAYFRSFSNLEQHVTILDGRMAGDTVERGPRGPVLEAVVSVATADMFRLKAGHVVTLTPDIGIATLVSARIVGVIEATNPTEDYWKPHASLFLDPPEEGPELPGEVELESEGEVVAIPLFVTQEALVEGVGGAYPGTLIDSLWFIFTDTERLKDWSVAETLRRFEEFESDISKAMPGSDVFSSITKTVRNVEKARFFSRVPMLLLLAIMVVTVLFFLSMMVSYLVQSREVDTVMLRTRGVGTLQILRLYALEGLVMTALAVVLAPFLAIAMVALAGKLPSFSGMTGGGFLPVEIGVAPFLMAAGAGLLCLVIFVVPGVLGARSGLLTHKLRSSRPPTLPFFHRYYLDVALLVLGGLTFWELSSRGQFISGGLFNEVEVNETLLIAPVLFLIVVALVFIRFFPLVVRYLSGESPAVVHLGVVATVLVLGAGVALRETREGNVAGWVGPVAVLVSFAVLYWATQRSRGVALRVGGLVFQGVLVGGFVIMERPVLGDALFAPAIVLIMLVPAQVLFLLLVALTRRSPVWLSMGMWHMSRNPLQYTWLVLLLVLVTGVGILSTTVGGTLERSREDRIQYDMAADIHVTGVPRLVLGGARGLKERTLRIPGVTSGTVALRETAGVAHATAQVLALESRQFPYMSWYRDDFSASSLGGLMDALRSNSQVEKLEIPEGATAIGVWARPTEAYSGLSMWVAIETASGYIEHLSLGDLGGPPEWRLMGSVIPQRLRRPLHLVSMQIYEAGGKIKTPGTLLLDDIMVAVGPSNEEVVLEDFEGQMRWTAIVTSPLAPDRILPGLDAFGGQRIGVFSFGPESEHGYRGIYVSPTAGPVPVVVSSSFVETTGVRVGDAFVANISGRRVPMVIRDTVDYFPTMVPGGNGFILADLDNLTGHLNVLNYFYSVTPNELFLKEAPTARQNVREAVSALTLGLAQVEHMGTQLDSVRGNPLSTAGWNSIVLLSLGIVVLSAGLGYVTYLLSFASRSKGEMGFLQSMGLSRRQLWGLLGFEQLAIAVIGLGLGTWAGLQLSALMVSPLAITERGEQVVPPFILMTDWSLMLPTYAALLGIFTAALYVLNRSVGRLDLRAISREEGL